MVFTRINKILMVFTIINKIFMVFTRINKIFMVFTRINKQDLSSITSEFINGILHQEYLKIRVKKMNIFKDIELENFNSIEIIFFNLLKVNISFML